jgi:hypothetical protein
MTMINQKERIPKQSVLFLLDECISSLFALHEIYDLHEKIHRMNFKEKEKLILSPEVVTSLVGSARDYFCIRIANLFDQRKDVHSLVKYYNGDDIDALKNHPIVIAAIKARHNNIGHMGKKYTKWPNIDDVILAEDLRNLLKTIRVGVIFAR